MKRLLPVLMGFVVLLLSSTEGWSSPSCLGSPTGSASTAMSWTNCFGTLTYADGENYVGEFKNGLPNGQGTYTFASGSKYVGEYKDGKRNGHFTVTYANRNKYVSEYKNDKKNGQGTYYFLADNKHKGDIYVGEYKDNKFNGQGTYTFASGSKKKSCCKHVGEWKNNLPNGLGIHTYADGRIEGGMYENGKFKYAKKSPLEKAKQQCAEIGFKEGTEKFGDCVMKLLN